MWKLACVILSCSSLACDSNPNSPDAIRTRMAIPGETLTLTKSIICMMTEDGIDSVIKAAGIDQEEYSRELKRQRGVFLPLGEKIKVLEVGWSKARVRVLRADAECWTNRDGVEVRR